MEKSISDEHNHLSSKVHSCPTSSASSKQFQERCRHYLYKSISTLPILVCPVTANIFIVGHLATCIVSSSDRATQTTVWMPFTCQWEGLGLLYLACAYLCTPYPKLGLFRCSYIVLLSASTCHAGHNCAPRMSKCL